jgi:RNA polymerase sigma-70 factor (ECF subfamily)
MNEFGRLLEKEIPRLRRYAFALTRNMSRADDLVQDTLVRAIAKQRGWQWGTNLRGWLFTLMHNQNVNGVRRSAREGMAVEFDDTWPFPTAATDPAAGLSLRDLDRALARISEEQRQVVLLIGLEDISYKEAATILDVPIGTIRSRLSRGRESLRIVMDRTHATEPVNRAAITSAPSKPKRFVPGFERAQNSRLLPM